MRNRIFIAYILFVISFGPYAAAQHENCDHGDAPSVSDQMGVSNFIHVDKMSMDTINLKTERAEAKNIDNLVTAIGKIENIPERVSVVSTRIAGRVSELYISPDSAVKEGDPICKIESFLPGTPPPSIVITAPNGGIVEELNVYKGSPVEQNTQIARIVDTSTLYAAANVFENNLGRLKPGLSARINLEAFKGKTFLGKLVKFGSKISPDSNTLPVYFLLENPKREVKSGMRGIFHISTDTGSAPVAVKKSAIIGDEIRKFVFVERNHEGGIFEKRQVIAGKSDDVNTEILHGLKSGEIVATVGAYQLQFMPAASELEIGASRQINADAAESDLPPHDHTQHGETEPKDEHDASTHIDHIHSQYEHLASTAENQPPETGNGKVISGEISLIDKLMESGYFYYLLLSILAGSILLNVIFAAAFARKNREEK